MSLDDKLDLSALLEEDFLNFKSNANISSDDKDAVFFSSTTSSSLRYSDSDQTISLQFLAESDNSKLLVDEILSLPEDQQIIFEPSIVSNEAPPPSILDKFCEESPNISPQKQPIASLMSPRKFEDIESIINSLPKLNLPSNTSQEATETSLHATNSTPIYPVELPVKSPKKANSDIVNLKSIVETESPTIRSVVPEPVTISLPDNESPKKSLLSRLKSPAKSLSIFKPLYERPVSNNKPVTEYESTSISNLSVETNASVQEPKNNILKPPKVETPMLLRSATVSRSKIPVPKSSRLPKPVSKDVSTESTSIRRSNTVTSSKFKFSTK